MTEQQQEASRDAVMTRIGQAIMLLHGGDREEARNRFGAIWSEIGEDGDALHRCTSRTTWQTPRTIPGMNWLGT